MGKARRRRLLNLGAARRTQWAKNRTLVEPVAAAQPPAAAEPPVAPGEDGPPELEEIVEPLEDRPLLEPLAAGEMVASYRIVALLRSEPHLNFYEAVALPSGSRVWLREAGDEATAARLRHEAAVLAELDVPMFPTVHGCSLSDGRTYLATEWVEPEGSLADLLARQPAPLAQVVPVLAQVAFALSRLHAAGWVHLGLRPEVVALGKPVKLLDLSYAARPGGRPASPFYHAGYSPPELATGEPVDGRADIYSVGALLFHAVNGQAIAESGAQLGSWQPAVPVAGVPQLLHRCLGGPATRYPTMEELHRDLLRLARRGQGPARYTIAAATTIGLEPTRTTNQDAYATLSGRFNAEETVVAWALLAVADGMGGMAAGEVAAQAAVTGVLAEAAALSTSMPADRGLSSEEQVELTRRLVHTANEWAGTALEAREAHGGCTLLCACLVERRLTMAHVGDCRLYLLRPNRQVEAVLPSETLSGEAAITQLSQDHSLAMALVRQGEITLEELRRHPDRSTVTRSLGDRRWLPELFIDTLEAVTGTATLELHDGDVLLVCSDGLWEPVREEEMLDAVRRYPANLDAVADALLNIALGRGAPDNVTVVLLRLDNAAGC